MARSLAGRLLVASPILDDPNFARSVVLICTHDRGGAFGLVLNRPLSGRVDEYLPEWSGPLAEPAVMFGGGPVDVTSAFGLGIGVGVPGDAWSSARVAGSGGAECGVVDLGRAGELESMGVQQFRLYSGYAGWVGGQLESELLGEAWFVVDALPEDVFTPRPEALWHEVLRRQRGRLAMFGFFPDDPKMN